MGVLAYRKNGTPSVVIANQSGASWGVGNKTVGVKINYFSVDFDLSLTPGVTTITFFSPGGTEGYGQSMDVGWGDGTWEYGWRESFGGNVASKDYGSAVSGTIRIVGASSKWSMQSANSDMFTTIRSIGNWQLTNSAWYDSDNLDFESNNLDTSDMPVASSIGQAFRLCDTLSRGIGQLNIDFDITNTSGTYFMQQCNNYLNYTVGGVAPTESWDGWNMSGQSGAWNRALGRTAGVIVDTWDMSGLTDIGFCWTGGYDGDTSTWFPVGTVTSILDTTFQNNANFQGTGCDQWNTGSFVILKNCFSSATAFSADISGWDVSNVRDFSQTFQKANSFNPATDVNGIESWSIHSDYTSTGTSTGQSTNRLIDSSATFITDGVKVDDYVRNTTTNTATQVSSIISETELALDTDIFLAASGETYRVFDSISMAGMFAQNTSTNRDIGVWRMNCVVSIASMFECRFNSCAMGFDLNQWERTTPGDESTMANVTNMSSLFFGSVRGFTQAQLAQVQDWDVSGCRTFANMFLQNNKMGNNFDTVCDLSNWVFNPHVGISLNGFFSTAQSAPTGFNSTNWNTGTQYVTAFQYCFYSLDFTNPDFSQWNVTNGSRFDLFIQQAGQIDRDVSNWELSSATIMTSAFNTLSMSDVNKANSMIGWAGNANTNTGVTATSIFGSSQSFLKSATVGVEGYDGQAAYNGFLTLTAPIPASNRTSGTNTSTNTNQLIDSGATFTATVGIGDVVANTTAGTYSEVATVDSDTTLTLADDIFTATSQAYSVDGGYGWVLTGTSFT